MTSTLKKITIGLFVFIIFAISTTLTAQTFKIEATFGEESYKKEGGEKCAYIDFGDSYGIYFIDDFAKLEDDVDKIVVSVANAPTVGTFSLDKLVKGNMLDYGVYYEKGDRRLSSADIGGGSLNITEVKDDSVSGTFEYMAKDSDGSEILVKANFTAKKLDLE